MNLESDKRLNIQLGLDFSSAPTGEARQAGGEDIESLSVVSEPERPANTCRIMEDACERANLKEALRQGVFWYFTAYKNRGFNHEGRMACVESPPWHGMAASAGSERA